MESDLSTNPGDGDSCQCDGDSSSAGVTEAERRGSKGKGPDRREEKRVDRRVGLQRRKLSAEAAGFNGPDRRSSEDRRTGLERRRGPGRRLSDDRKSAEEGEMSEHQFEFVMAIQTYKKVNKRLYPTWTEILEIVNQLGYRKIKPRKLRLDTPEAPLFDPNA
jgi:hypothetical protein